ncbi:hypothetical protein [Mesobacillus jeotgali]|uniref:hypothetical protein n=1 Tax=Mesobacillus jeotgali TaxID=129985 RepID=UPI000C837F01|nr:hypothetical protein [Mesobacillus jeotgali]
MKVESVIFIINNLISKRQYGNARDLIKKEWTRITEPLNFSMLNSEAKEFVKVIAKEQEIADFILLSDKDKRILNMLNEAVREVKLPYARKLFFEHKELFQLVHSQKWLTEDARFMCFAWGKNA